MKLDNLVYYLSFGLMGVCIIFGVYLDNLTLLAVGLLGVIWLK